MRRARPAWAAWPAGAGRRRRRRPGHAGARAAHPENGVLRCAVGEGPAEELHRLRRSPSRPSTAGRSTGRSASRSRARSARGRAVTLVDLGCKRSTPERLARTGLEVLTAPRRLGRRGDSRHAPARGAGRERPRGSASARGAGADDPVAARPGAAVWHLPGPPAARHALGLDVFKLPFGHRGANHPVRRPTTAAWRSRSRTTATQSWPDSAPDGVEVTRTSLFDGSVEGIAAPELRPSPCSTTPEASPGPHDARYMFREFVAGIDMPRRDDLRTILILGSGPIVIGQAGEFDYSGTQGARALRREGYRVVLVNSNPATIMTDPSVADATYVEPLDPEAVEAVIAIERPDALLATLGGQTALNLAMELDAAGVLDRYGVELIGADIEAIRRAEDREVFRDTMAEAGLAGPGEPIVTDLALGRPRRRAALPVILRPAFTLGGEGGRPRTPEELDAPARGASPQPDRPGAGGAVGARLGGDRAGGDRGRADNAVVVCSIENIDPMGVHTGDSVTVAPVMTLTDTSSSRSATRRSPCPRGRRLHRRRQRPVRPQPPTRRGRRHRDEPARVALLRAGVQGHRVPDREDRGAAWRWGTRSTSCRTRSPGSPRPASSRPSTTSRSRCRASPSRSSPAAHRAAHPHEERGRGAGARPDLRRGVRQGDGWAGARRAASHRRRPGGPRAGDPVRTATTASRLDALARRPARRIAAHRHRPVVRGRAERLAAAAAVAGAPLDAGRIAAARRAGRRRHRRRGCWGSTRGSAAAALGVARPTTRSTPAPPSSRPHALLLLGLRVGGRAAARRAAGRSSCWARARTASARGSSSTTAASTPPRRAGARLRRRDGQLQPRDGLHRPRRERPPLPRAAHRRRRPRHLRGRAAPRRDRPARRPDAAAPGARARRRGRPDPRHPAEAIDLAEDRGRFGAPARRARPRGAALGDRRTTGRGAAGGRRGLPGARAPLLRARRPRRWRSATRPTPSAPTSSGSVPRACWSTASSTTRSSSTWTRSRTAATAGPPPSWSTWRPRASTRATRPACCRPSAPGRGWIAEIRGADGRPGPRRSAPSAS